MAYVSVPKDLAQVKTKVFMNLTKRQLICFGGGILIGLPLFFIFRGFMPNSTAALLMMLVMLPCFMFGMYEKNGQPLERILYYFVQSRFIRPRQRLYRTDNVYNALMRQSQLTQEVNRIVHQAKIRTQK